MTNEEAITYFKHILSGQYGKNTTRGFALQRAAFERAIEALEKQTPKKPTFDIDLTFDDDEIVIPCCSVCDAVVYEDDIFCCNCGQAIDWGDTE